MFDQGDQSDASSDDEVARLIDASAAQANAIAQLGAAIAALAKKFPDDPETCAAAEAAVDAAAEVAARHGEDSDDSSTASARDIVASHAVLLGQIDQRVVDIAVAINALSQKMTTSAEPLD